MNGFTFRGKGFRRQEAEYQPHSSKNLRFSCLLAFMKKERYANCRITQQEAVMNREDEIRRVAYELYERSGMTPGRDIENWLKAEKIVMARHAETAKAGAASPKLKKASATKTARTSSAKTETAKAGPKKPGTRKK
jgi:hypothetical protein